MFETKTDVSGLRAQQVSCVCLTGSVSTAVYPQEAAYAREFFRLFGRHMKSALLDHLPE